MRISWLAPVLVLVLAGGCRTRDTTEPDEVHRFVVDEIWLPRNNVEAREMGGDLDGDKVVDNSLGQAVGALTFVGNTSPHAAEMIRSGAIASFVELRANDLEEDRSAMVQYVGADGAEGVPVGGELALGAFLPIRTVTAARPGEALVRLPVFLEADPSEILLHGLEIELAPDGAGGYQAELHGAVTFMDALAAVHRGLSQMVASNPQAHLTLAREIDTDRDGAFSLAEVKAAPLVQGVLQADVVLRGFEGELLSLGFRVHLAPCVEGRCIDAAPVDQCHDRVRDGDETDVDCGGSCPLACAGGLACRAPADCQSRTCNGGGCAAPSCTDGVCDGFETGIDCGGICGIACPP